MSVDPASPLARRTSLMARMRNVAASVPGTDPARRVQLTLAMDRYLARLLATTEWGSWVLKGGYANQLRTPAEARFTQDVDLKLDAPIDEATTILATAGLGVDRPHIGAIPQGVRDIRGTTPGVVVLRARSTRRGSNRIAHRACSACVERGPAGLS